MLCAPVVKFVAVVCVCVCVWCQNSRTMKRAGPRPFGAGPMTICTWANVMKALKDDHNHFITSMYKSLTLNITHN